MGLSRKPSSYMDNVRGGGDTHLLFTLGEEKSCGNTLV